MADANVVLALRLMAALAAQLASQYEQDKLWPGELSSGLDRINTASSDARRGDLNG